MKPRVLALTDLPEDLRERLEAEIELEVQPAGELSDAAVARRVEGFHGLIPLLIHRVGPATFEAADRLKIVANVAVGVDNVDLESAGQAGIAVTHTPGVLTDDTADLAFGLLLAAVRRLGEADRYVRQGRFTGWKPDLLLGRSLASLTLGVVGAGRIGRAVLERARAFGMRRLYASRSALAPEVERDLGARRRTLEELLTEADVVSLHVPLTDETRHLIDQRALERMKPGSYLINTARGPVVDEAALVEALRSEKLAGAGLDVFENEPRVHPDLLELDRVVLAPHIGSATVETRHAMAELAVESVLDLLVRGRWPEHLVVDPRNLSSHLAVSTGDARE